MAINKTENNRRETKIFSVVNDQGWGKIRENWWRHWRHARQQHTHTHVMCYRSVQSHRFSSWPSRFLCFGLLARRCYRIYMKRFRLLSSFSLGHERISLFIVQITRIPSIRYPIPVSLTFFLFRVGTYRQAVRWCWWWATIKSANTKHNF